MRLKLRLILSFLIMAIIAVAFLIFQANLLFTRQLRTLKEEAAQALEMIDRETINQNDVTQILLNNQAEIDQVLVSIRFEVVILISILFILLGGLSIWFAVRFSAPFERIAASANHLLQLVQNAAAQGGDLNSENVEKFGADSYTEAQTFKKEESLIAYTLDIITPFVRDELTNLKNDLSKNIEENKFLSERMIDLEQFIHETTEEFDVKLLLDEMTQRIAQQFHSSFVGVYFIDESRQFVELKAAFNKVKASVEHDGHMESGQLDFEKNIRFKVNETEKSGEGIVGRAAVTGEVCQSDDLIHFAQILPGSEIPNITSEVAIPMRVRGVVLGVMVIISQSKSPYSPEEIAILQAYADLLALVNEYEKTIEASTPSEERSVYGDITRQAWDAMMQDRSDWGYRSDEKGINKIDGEWHSAMRQAVQQGRVVVWQDENFSIASVPIRVRDYTLGVLDFRKTGVSAWTSDELLLVQTLTDQLGQALESARLYQNTQMRAERERVLSDITSKVRASTNVEVILQTAIRELAEALRVPKGSIQLRSSSNDSKERHYPSTIGGKNDA